MDRYHVVCHECPEEAICDSRQDAEALVEDHREATGHRVSVGTISMAA